MKNIAKFTSPDNSQVLTLRAWDGKSGFRVLASIKTKGSKDKAITGAREGFKTEAEALKALEALDGEARKKGWHPLTVTKRNAFSSLPTAPSDTAPTSKAVKSAKAA